VDGYSGYLFCCRAGDNKRASTILKYHMDGINQVRNKKRKEQKNIHEKREIRRIEKEKRKRKERTRG
jgi:hypothetical protein